MSQPTQTETGINVATYSEDKAKGQVSITKPIKNSSNYIYMKAQFTLSMENGVPTATESAPQILNLNRGSLQELSGKIQAEIEKMEAVRAEVAVMLADMDALDA